MKIYSKLRTVSDIINGLSFHGLNFDKNFVKYCKRLKENYTLFLKFEKNEIDDC